MDTEYGKKRKGLFSPLEGGKLYAHLFFAIAGAIYCVFEILNWYTDILTRLKFPHDGRWPKVTEMDYIWIKVLFVIFLASTFVLAVSRWYFRKSVFLPVLFLSFLAYWALQTINPLIVPAAPDPAPGNFPLTVIMLAFSSLLPTVFISCSLALAGNGIVGGMECLAGKLHKKRAPGTS